LPKRTKTAEPVDPPHIAALRLRAAMEYGAAWIVFMEEHGGELPADSAEWRAEWSAFLTKYCPMVRALREAVAGAGRAAS
jgi:hypothetical protein